MGYSKKMIDISDRDILKEMKEANLTIPMVTKCTGFKADRMYKIIM